MSSTPTPCTPIGYKQVATCSNSGFHECVGTGRGIFPTIAENSIPLFGLRWSIFPGPRGRDRSLGGVQRPVQLTTTEDELLRLLSVNVGRVATYDSLPRKVWGPGESGDYRPARAPS